MRFVLQDAVFPHPDFLPFQICALQARDEALHAAAGMAETQRDSLSNMEQKLCQVVADFQVASEKDSEQITQLVKPPTFRPNFPPPLIELNHELR
jgi:hypothetical protein